MGSGGGYRVEGSTRAMNLQAWQPGCLVQVQIDSLRVRGLGFRVRRS